MHDLRLLAGLLLEVAAHQQVEQLVGAAELHVGLDLDGVVRLEQRVEELHQRDRGPPSLALGEVVALEHPGDRDVRGEVEGRLPCRDAEPVRVVVDELESPRERRTRLACSR